MLRKVFRIFLVILLLASLGFAGSMFYRYQRDQKNRKADRQEEKREIQSISSKAEESASEESRTEEEPSSEEATEEDTEKADPEILTAELAYPLAKEWSYSLLDIHKTTSTIHLPDAESVKKAAEEKQHEELAELEAKGELPPEEEIPVITIYNPLALTPSEGATHPAEPGEDVLVNQTVYSTNLILVDAETGEVLVERDSDEVIYPASMIKILTVLVAVDYIHDWDDTYLMPDDLIDYVYANQCSAVGFLRGETVTVRDMFYGTIVCSGADACLGLARYCCGTEKEFVRRMNLKLQEMGLSETAHVSNCIGIHEEDQYCTVGDMAVILEAAMQNPFVADALALLYYKVDPDEMVPEGIMIANAFMCRIEDTIPGGAVLGAKTGYSPAVGFHAASIFEREDGRRFICITVNANSTWRSIYDHIALYRSYT